jgi:tryptophan-rich sensory protein
VNRKSFSRFLFLANESADEHLSRPARSTFPSPWRGNVRLAQTEIVTSKKSSLALFIILVVGVGLLIGLVTVPGEWYAGLAKPSFNPPGWIFAPVWTALYVLIAIAGWRTWQRNLHGSSMKLWGVQMALNFLWSPVFFAAHQITTAFIVIIAMLATILMFIASAWRADRAAALLFMPYAAWVAFAAVLNGSIVWLNG